MHKLTFQREYLADARADPNLPALLARHWAEIALNQDTVPLAPDWERYHQMEFAGALHITTARDERGFIVGYAVFLVGENAHYKGLTVADGDIFYLHPSYRQGLAGLSMLRAAEDLLREVGVNMIVNKDKMHAPLGIVFKRMGYEPIETVYAKMIAAPDSAGSRSGDQNGI